MLCILMHNFYLVKNEFKKGWSTVSYIDLVLREDKVLVYWKSCLVFKIRNPRSEKWLILNLELKYYLNLLIFISLIIIQIDD